MADPTQLELAILNTAFNARDAVPNGCSLTIKDNVRHDGREFVQVEIRDTGAGIPPERLERVFDPYFTTKNIDRGTGWGLSNAAFNRGVSAGRFANPRIWLRSITICRYLYTPSRRVGDRCVRVSRHRRRRNL
jgi:hypothetical protein